MTVCDRGEGGGQIWSRKVSHIFRMTPYSLRNVVIGVSTAVMDVGCFSGHHPATGDYSPVSAGQFSGRSSGGASKLCQGASGGGCSVQSEM